MLVYEDQMCVEVVDTVNMLGHGGRWYRPHGAKAVMEVAGTGPWHEGS